MKNHSYVHYNDPSDGHSVLEFLIKEEEGILHFCSPCAYKFAEEWGKVACLNQASMKTLPSGWTNHKRAPRNKPLSKLPSIISNNLDEIRTIIGNDMTTMVRVVDFLEELQFCSESRFESTCVNALILTKKHLSNDVLKKLFEIVFSHYEDYFSRLRVRLLANKHLVPYVSSYSVSNH